MSPDPTSLDRLHDVITPAPVPWWPPAPGWYGLGGLILVLLIVGLIRGFASWQANRYRREALHELARHKNELHDPGKRAEALMGMATLLKRAALTVFPREKVASLSGPAWLAFLDRTGRTKTFTEGPGHYLEKVAYDPRCAAVIKEEELARLESMVRRWLSQHRVKPDSGELA